MREVPLPSSGLVALVDDGDFRLVSHHKWWAHNKLRYAATEIGGRQVLMHRLILCLPSGWPHVDHRDHNGLNNQRHNIRVATREQNKQNERKRSGCTSNFKGVSWRRDRGIWVSQIEHCGRKMHLGYFRNEIEAALAYNAAAGKLFGSFALVNALPPEGDANAGS